MRLRLRPGQLLLPLLLVAAVRATEAPQPGPLVIVGGGGTPPEALARALDFVPGEADVVVLPFASARENRGEGSVAMWLEAGAASAQNVEGADDPAALIAAAEIVWMPGGDQSVLMEELRTRGLIDDVRAAHARGAVVGGTSAGAAVMTAVMIARSAEDDALIHGRTPTTEGLGLFEGAIVDQHFVRRGRNVRLLAAVLERPQVLGFGIDERTALVVHPDGACEVVGASQVLVYDARKAKIRRRESDGRFAVRGLRLDVLVAGDRFEFGTETK